MSDRQIVTLEQGWSSMQNGINKLIRLLEGEPEDQFNAEQYMHLYTTIYNMCTQKPPHDYSEQLYAKYKEAFTNYIAERVLPSLRDQHDELLLKELYQRWQNHKLMVRWLSRFFNYLDRYYVLRHTLPTLKDVGLMSFRDLVYLEIKRKAKEALLRMIEKERDGELVDRALIKNILGIFIEVGMGNMDNYERDFEEHLLNDTKAYYKRQADAWIEQDSCPDYMLMAEDHIRMEEERAEAYLVNTTKVKLLKEVETEVLANKQVAILTKEHSGCAALLRDDKADDLARMYRLFLRIPKGLDLVADLFKQHVESEGDKLAKELSEEVESIKAQDADELVRSVIDLHDKYLVFVSTSFNNAPLFHKSLKEAFEALYKKNVARSTVANVMAKFCNKQMKEDGGRARMYRLFNRIPNGLDLVAGLFKQHVESEGNKLVKEVSEEVESKKAQDAAKAPTKDTGTPAEQRFVRSVIDLHDKYLIVVSKCFNNASLFHRSLKDAFEAFCNKQVAGSTMAELMASFCDNVLKKGGTEKLSDEAIEGTLDQVVKLLAFISDKDLFAEFYRKKLSRRLLHDKSSSDDHERSILSRLKQHCGAQFTFKMEGMVTDLQLARDKQAAFNGWMTQRNRNLPIDVSVTVLTTGLWPTYKATELALPREMVEGVELFKEFYNVNNTHRRLTWVHSLGICMVKGNFDAKLVELAMSTMQAAICLLFIDAEELSYNEIKDRVNLQDDDVVRLLHSLSCAKYRLLLKDPASKSIGKSDKFRFNNKFTDRMRRIKIPLPPVDEKRKVIEDVDKERQYTIDAAIVRTMKSRKVLQHQQLVMEVVQQLSCTFKPDFKLIKKRIEDLVTRVPRAGRRQPTAVQVLGISLAMRIRRSTVVLGSCGPQRLCLPGGGMAGNSSSH